MKVKLCEVKEIPEMGAKTADFFGREVLVFWVNGQPKAVLNVGMHLGGPMILRGNRLLCAWHAAAFVVAGGRCLEGPGRPGSWLITLPTQSRMES